ncbi:probable glutathione S-transferase GSTU6 [Lolium rigidum]|uniref:probable glutathione S-transferase GSTU6 n=1 Tax=Lolium rigidum TaxID=89674 RepID=UPI001F5E21B8|nr:probable glutathione S-transferase GSTU6 [Lolium rigidum]
MAGGDELKLLGSWLSPFATRVKLALALKGLSYAEVEEDLCNKSELLLRSNPVHKKVPVLIHNGVPVCESVIIMQYIDEAFAGAGPSLLPLDPHERAVARFWASYIDEKLVIPWVRSFRGTTEEEKSEGLKQAFAAVENLEGALRECSKGKGGFFGGDGIGLVDITLGSLLTWAHAAEVMSGTRIFDPARTPLLAAWMVRFDELDVAKAVLPDVGRMVEFKTKQARALAAARASDSK